MTIPVCDKAKGINTPIVYSGIKLSVLASNINNNTTAPVARVIIPFE